MVRATKPRNSNHHQEEEEDDGDEFPPEAMDASCNRDGHSSEQKTNSSRSKHSETEQRRRSKINERFQTLKDLIPTNDQRRDKASLLLEVIEYIRFLHDRIQLFEGSCQGWGQETTKLMPWRNSNALGDGYSGHSHFMNNGCAQDNNYVQPMTNIQSIVPSDFGCNAYEGTQLVSVSEPASSAPSNSNMSPLPTMYSRRCILPAEDLTSQAELQAWRCKSSVVECAATSNTTSTKDKTQESCVSNISNAYSQGLLKSLTEALQTSGVDLSQANISVQLEAGKRRNSTQSLSSSAYELPGKGSSSSQIHYREESAEDPILDAKRLRAE